jgi:hypothetical protein
MFVRMDRAVLGAVVCEDAPHLGHAADQPHVCDQHYQAEHALDRHFEVLVAEEGAKPPGK